MLPLEGVRVVEIAQNLAGPMAAEILAHMGADVIKVERPEGDDARRWGPPFFKGTSPGYLAVNANKRSITVDLKDQAAVERLIELIGEADVLVQNLRPGSLEALGLGADVLTKRFPRLIYCSVWAFGRTGPLKMKPGYEPMVQAFSGLMMMNGDEGGPPTRIGTSILDYGTGMWAAMGVLGALVGRAATGRGASSTPRCSRRGWPGSRATTPASAPPACVPERHRTGSNRRGAVPGLRDEDRPRHRRRRQRPALRQARQRRRPPRVGEGPALRDQRRPRREQGRAAAIRSTRSSSRAARASGSTCSRPRGCRAR